MALVPAPGKEGGKGTGHQEEGEAPGRRLQGDKGRRQCPCHRSAHGKSSVTVLLACLSPTLVFLFFFS